MERIVTVVVADLRQQLLLLRGKECWSVLAGAGTGSTVHIEFGDRIPRRKPLRNRNVSQAQAMYEGELDLFIQCAWRLERHSEVVCGSTDDDRNDGPMVHGLSKLVGKDVVVTEIADPIPDLIVRFVEDLCLRVFCDQTNLETNDDNYSLRVGDTIFAVGARGRLSREGRTSQ